MVNVQEIHKRPQPQVPETLSNSPGLTPGPLQNCRIPLTGPMWLTNLLLPRGLAGISTIAPRMVCFSPQNQTDFSTEHLFLLKL